MASPSSVDDFAPPLEGYTYPSHLRIGDLVVTNSGNLRRVYAYSSEKTETGVLFPTIILQDPKYHRDFLSICDDEFHLWSPQRSYQTAEERAADEKQTEELFVRKTEAREAARKAFLAQLPDAFEFKRFYDMPGTHAQFREYNEEQYEMSVDEERQFIDYAVSHKRQNSIMDYECGGEAPVFSLFFSTRTGRLVSACCR